jgi:hypothetical protein
LEHPSVQAYRAPQNFVPCRVCERGTLTNKKIFRMSGPVVVIGFIFLIPAVLGMLLSVAMFLRVLSAGGAAGSEASSAKDEAVAHMRENNIPEPLIAAVVAGRNAEVESQLRYYDLAQYQRSWVRDAQEKIRTSDIGTAASGFGVLVGGGFAIAVGVASFVGGLVGWLLVMKKRVLQCSTCGAVINAS